MCLICFSATRTLNDEEVALAKPIFRDLDIPFQPPVVVTNVTCTAFREDKHTGRIIEFSAPRNGSASCSAYISFPFFNATAFGRIVSFFSYRSVEFVLVDKFEPPLREEHGLIFLSNSFTTKCICPFNEVSRPLVVALNDNELCILS